MSQTSAKIWDVVIVGAGAAGLIAAITLRRSGLEVLLLEGGTKAGSKILISGGARCNLTNQDVSERDYESQEKIILRSVLRAFTPEATLQLFEGLGVETITEGGGKIFPTTHSSRTVLEALLREVEKLGIRLERSRKATHIVHKADCFQIACEGFSYRAKAVLLATGGLSYPETGCDGSGFAIARSFGHTVIPMTPSLVPLLTNDGEWKSLSGISLPVRLSYWEKGKKIVSSQGDLLFTHKGFSGPAVLDISRHWIRSEGSDEPKILCDFLPNTKEEIFRKYLLDENPNYMVKKILLRHYPSRFTEIVLDKMGIAQTITLNQLKKAEREALVRFLFHYPLPITGNLGYEKAEVTAGGVSLAEVDRSTLESKLQPGLYLAGEMLDVDGRIGGFNFQWAWSSGVVAARGIAKRLSAPK